MNKKKSGTYITIVNVILAIFALVALGITILSVHSNAVAEEQGEPVKKSIKEYQEDIKYYTDAKEDYTPKKVNTKISEDKMDVKAKIDQKRKDIKDGVTQVYEDTNSVEDYEKLEDKITPLLGSSFSNELIELDKPSISQAEGEQLAYDKLNDLKIAFGEYDIANHTTVCYVLADYQSPSYKTGSAGEDDEDDVVLKGQDFFILNYSLEDDELELVNYQKSNQNEVTADE